MANPSSIRFKDRAFTASELKLIREVVASCAGLSRQELANTACELLGWRRPNGGLKTWECKELLVHLESVGRIELPARTWELAAETGVNVKHVTVRNQRSRWGSCSAGGTISLNWRLVQAPDAVRDYIIYHELMHLREMNHSDSFWARVAEVCPWWRESERWLKHHGSLLGL